MLNKTKKNVIYIILDSLRFDRMGFGGHKPTPSPNMDKLFASGLSLTNCFTAGCATEFAYPALTTSTLPLDKGGYAMGIRDREITLAEVLKKEGYRTGIFFEDHYRSPAGYSRGFDESFLLFDLFRFLADVGDTIPYYSNMLKSGKKSLEDCTDAVEEYLTILFPDIVAYCTFMQESVEKRKLLPSLLLHDYNYTVITDVLKNAEKKFHADPKKYILNLLNKNEKVFEQIFEIVKTRQNNPKTINVDKKLRPLLLKSLKYLIFSSLKGRVSKETIKNCIRRILFKQNKSIQFVSAAYIINNLLNWIDYIPKDKPFFAWINIADIHEQNFSSYDIPGGEGMVKEEMDSLNALYSEIILQKDNYYGNPLYDFAVKYTDMQIGRFIQMLKNRNLLDNTLIVLTADHGHTSTGWPIRKNVHIARDFYDELYHIPVSFINKDIPAGKIKGMCSSLDIAPTLLNLLDIQIPSAFRGMPINTEGNVGRNYVLMEHLGPGPCDFKLYKATKQKMGFFIFFLHNLKPSILLTI